MGKFMLSNLSEIVNKMIGYEHSQPPASAAKYTGSRLGKVKLPSRVDLRSEMTEVESQLQTSSCTANAVAGAVEYLVKQHLGDDAYDVSRMFIYYNARYLNPNNKQQIKDAGSTILHSIQGLKEYGVCSEDTWSFDVQNVNEEPDSDAYDEAQNFVIEGEETLDLDLNTWKKALAEGYPIIFGVKTYKTFDSHKTPGLIPMPSKDDASRTDHGRHVMLCVGYSDKDQVFIVRNSWGNKWGDRGYCYMPYNYVLSPVHNLAYNAIIKHAEVLEVNEDTWSDEEEEDDSVLGDYESELANMEDEDYEEMLEAMGDYPLEYRIAIIFMHVANAEGDFSEKERRALLQYMTNTLEKLGSEYDAKEVLEYCWENAGEDEDILEESIELLGEYLSTEMLATIVNDLRAVVGVDGESDDESEYIDYIVGEWQTSEEEGDEEDEDYDEEEEEEEEDEEE